ncbi:MAG: hypothetical protein FWG81_00020 [Betaproteobacteria bacterium]|nr:hypothetical protein [Betaproteobacteria bacterium]
MPKRLPSKKKTQIEALIYARADDVSYRTLSRPESSQFLDSLVEDAAIGGVLREYYPKENVRTYIKDGILNAYAKQFTKNALNEVSPTDAIQQIYGVLSSIIQQGTGKEARVSVSRSDDGRIFVLSGGTVLKWETALRKALEIIARVPGLTIEGKTPSICLHLVPTNNGLTVADKKHITTALAAVGVQAIFCDN